MDGKKRKKVSSDESIIKEVDTKTKKEPEMAKNSIDYKRIKNELSKRFIDPANIIEKFLIGLTAAGNNGNVAAFLLKGPAGTGKTFFAELVSEILGAEKVFFQCTLNTSEDDLLYRFIPSEQTKSGIKILLGPLPESLLRSQEKLTILIIDEFDKTRPSSDALLLDFLQNGRLSIKIDDRESIIVGNKSNLIVFITSNDFREFSEPLLRRVISLEFRPLPPVEIERKLKEKFQDEKIVKLLITIYKASLKAKLSKIITIQELMQLGYALQYSSDLSLEELLLSFVLKNEEDLEKLTKALEELKEEEREEENKKIEISAKLLEVVNNVSNNNTNNNSNNSNNMTVKQLLESIKVIQPKIEEIKPEVVKESEKIETTVNIEIKDTFREYTNLITSLSIQPSERPDILGKFKVILDETDNKLRIITDRPLDISESFKMIDNGLKGKYYIEDTVIISDFLKTFNEIYTAGYNLQIVYYTKDLIIIKSEDNNTIIRLEKLKSSMYKLKMYLETVDMRNSLKLLTALNGLQVQVMIEKFIKEIYDGFSYDQDYKEIKKWHGVSFKEFLKEYEGLKDLYKIEIKKREEGTSYFKAELQEDTLIIGIPPAIPEADTVRTWEDLVRLAEKYR
jgi:MoxR-like ATPase